MQVHVYCNLVEQCATVLGVAHAITNIKSCCHTLKSFFCAFDKGQLSLDLPHRTIETNDNKKDYSWYKKRCCSPVLIGEFPC